MKPSVLISAWPRGLFAGGLVLAAGVALLAARKPAPSQYRFTLDAPERADAYYVSAFNDGPVVLPHDARDGAQVVFTKVFEWQDHCTWQATETLRPIAENRYSYDYQERLISCEPGAEPWGTTPRTGFVDVEPL